MNLFLKGLQLIFQTFVPTFKSAVGSKTDKIEVSLKAVE